MAQPTADAPHQVSGLRKAAILTVVLGDEMSSEILRLLNEDEVELIGREVARVQAISGDQAEFILEECYQMVIAHDYVLKGGIEYARKLLVSAYGPEHAKKMLDRLMKSLGMRLRLSMHCRRRILSNWRSSSTMNIHRRSPWSCRT